MHFLTRFWVIPFLFLHGVILSRFHISSYESISYSHFYTVQNITEHAKRRKLWANKGWHSDHNIRLNPGNLEKHLASIINDSSNRIFLQRNTRDCRTKSVAFLHLSLAHDCSSCHWKVETRLIINIAFTSWWVCWRCKCELIDCRPLSL